MVWLGHDEVLERPVAVKVLSDTIASDPGFVARFRREARTMAGLSHPNPVGVYDFSEEGERPYLVMRFVPGEPCLLPRARAADRRRPAGAGTARTPILRCLKCIVCRAAVVC